MNYLQLDRAKFERAFLESSRRGVTAALMHFILYVFFLVFTQLHEAGWWKFIGLAMMSISLVSRTAVSIYATRKVANGEAIPPQRYQNIFRSSTFLMAFCWSFSFIGSYLQFGLTLPTMAIYVVIMGFAPASIAICPYDSIVSGSFIVCSALPVVIACLLTKGQNGPSFELAAFYSLHIVYSFTVLRRSKITFFDNIQTQLEVENQKRQLEGILDAVPGYVTWLDENGVSLGSNSLLAKALQPSDGKIRGHALSDLIGHDNQVATLTNAFREGASDEAVHEVQASLSGEKRWYILALRKFMTPNGPNTVAVAVDISNEKRAQDELSAEKSRVTQSERLSLIGAMAGGVAHEINNPLAIILGRLEKIRELDQAGELTPGQAGPII